MADYLFRQCTNKSCRLRYPASQTDPRGSECPRCGTRTEVAATRRIDTEASKHTAPERRADAPRVEVIVDNVRSLYNVGSIFRTADGAGIQHLHLCGITPTPENPKVAKTALGAEEAVAWRYWPSAVDAARWLQEQGAWLAALETEAVESSIFEIEAPSFVALVIGNEVAGIDPGVLTLADACVAIPMAGRKRSLNVATAFGIAAYFFQ